MNRIAIPLGLALVMILVSLAGGSEPLKVTATVGPRPYFVGQAIEVRVEVDPAQASRVVAPPRVQGGEVFPRPSDPDRPTAARFVVVPGRAGTLDLPPFRARSGDRSGASRTIKLTVANPPADGRPSTFLGGVGPFEVKAEAESTSVRLGQTLEARVLISGLAAFGSVRPPDLGEWASSTLKIERGGDRVEAGAVPVRTFVYRIRPLKSGTIRLPPVSVAAFDPTTRRYATRTSSSLPIQVQEPPRFDPATLGDPSPSTARPGPRRPTLILAIGGLAVALGSILAGWIVARRRRASRPVDPRELAFALASGLADEGDEVGSARTVAEALTTYLHRVGGRSPGVLTPVEARDGFDRLAADPGVSAMAERLMARCDRARFGFGSGESADLIAEGRGFFEAVAKVMVEERRKPGEAAEIASAIGTGDRGLPPVSNQT